MATPCDGASTGGGYTLRLPAGTSHLSGAQALALARTRHNDCSPGETDLVRARRQQKLFSAMEHRLLSIGRGEPGYMEDRR